MVETIEYILVFAITASLAGFSLFVVHGSLPALHQNQGESEFNMISGAAEVAVVGGSSSVLLPLTNASLDCSGGQLAFSDGGLNYSSTLGHPCDFAFNGLSCLCTLTFSRVSSGIALEVKR